MKTIIKLVLIFITNSFFIHNVQSLNILGIFPYQGKSHFFVFKPYLEELARRGHNLTVVSYFPREKPLANYSDVSLAGEVKIFEDVFPLERTFWSTFMISFFLVGSANENCKVLLSNKNVQNLWKSQTKYDLVIVEQFQSDCALGIAYHLGAPVLGITSHLLLPWHYDRLGIPYNPSYVPNLLLGGGTKPTLYDRVERTFFQFYFINLYKYFGQRNDEELLAQYFDDMPPLEDLSREIKMMLIYQNYVLTGSRLLPANVKEVNGYHVATPKKLPDDIRKFIEESENGVIYVSFGSMLKAAITPRDKVEAIIEALSQLPYRVIWKWEDKNLPGNPKNFYVAPWLPQNDILAHPKVVAFYSHCGLLGTTEAIYHGVPVVAMPIFGDQPANAAAVEESGLGVQIQIYELCAELLLEKFKTVLNPEFQAKVKELSRAWHDRPMSPMDSAIYWTEYAAKYKNYTFRSPSADVPLYQYLLLDTIAMFLLIFIVIIYICNFLISLFICKSKHKKE